MFWLLRLLWQVYIFVGSGKGVYVCVYVLCTERVKIFTYLNFRVGKALRAEVPFCGAPVLYKHCCLYCWSTDFYCTCRICKYFVLVIET